MTEVIWTILKCGAFAPFLETKTFTFEINGKKWPTRPFESLLLCSTEEIMSNRFETSWGWESRFSFLDELIHTYSMFYCIYFLLFPTGYFPLPLFSQCGHECVQNNVYFHTIISWFLPVPMVLQKPRVNPITPITHPRGFSSTRCAPATIWTCSSQLSSGSMLSPCPWSTTINLRYFLECR